ncbi:MAG: DUF6600 domain-containing protein [Hyphomicrobiaceae bacterium]
MWYVTSRLPRFAAVVLALMLAIALPPSSASAQDVDMEVFYRELAPHGQWFDHPRWGSVWSPYEDDREWRPYTRGHWVWTEEHGWYWNSEEPYGWATYHYGRWALDDEYGWIWVPDTVWGPAWVAWRRSDSYVGWAPLPPEARWHPVRGLMFASSYYAAPRYTPVWCFLPTRYMSHYGSVHRLVLPPGRNSGILRRTTYVTRYSRVNGIIVNRGLDVRFVGRATGRPVVPLRIVGVTSPRAHGRAPSGSRTIRVYRPAIARPRGQWRPTRTIPRHQLDRARMPWAGQRRPDGGPRSPQHGGPPIQGVVPPAVLPPGVSPRPRTPTGVQPGFAPPRPPQGGQPPVQRVRPPRVAPTPAPGVIPPRPATAPRPVPHRIRPVPTPPPHSGRPVGRPPTASPTARPRPPQGQPGARLPAQGRPSPQGRPPQGQPRQGRPPQGQQRPAGQRRPPQKGPDQQQLR